VRYNATVSRIYKDREDNQWKSTDSFGRDDLLVLAKVADLSHTWIHQQGQEARTSSPSVAGECEETRRRSGPDKEVASNAHSPWTRYQEDLDRIIEHIL
jgi:hypothetical protein